MSDRPGETILLLRQQGFDALQHHTLGVVAEKNGTSGSNVQTLRMLEDILFVPAGATLPDSEINRLADCLKKI